MTGWSIAGLVLMGLGLDRLVNLGLLGGDLAAHPVRFGVGAGSTILGGVLIALSRRFG
jgi:hypothetical protein